MTMLICDVSSDLSILNIELNAKKNLTILLPFVAFSF